MSNLTIQEVEDILNNTAINMFSSAVIIDFNIDEASEQIHISLLGELAKTHPYLKNRILSKKQSITIIQEIRKNSTQVSCSKIIINLLNKISVKKTDWNEYININLNIDKEVIEKAKLLLEDHIEGVKEFFIDSILEYINYIDIDRNELDEVWKEHFYKPTVIENLSSLNSYLTIKEKTVYPYLILSCKTGSIKLTESSSGKFLNVENNRDEINKLKETESILEKYNKNIKVFIDIQHIIDEITILDNISVYDNPYIYYDKVDYLVLYNKKMESYIKIDLIDGEIKIQDKVYKFSSIDLDKIKDEIENISIKVSNEVNEYFENKNKERKEKFNSPYVADILRIINDSPKKGITTYVSILKGERGSKISSNDYDKSESYASMSSLTKTYITDKIRDLIELGFIIENTFKASFGRYIGLTLAKEAKDFIVDFSTNITDDKDRKIENFSMFLSELRRLPSSRVISLLKSVSEDDIVFEKDDFDILLKFIETERPLYRDYEEAFNICISKIVPSIYKPLFLLNSNFASGVNKKTLKSIYDLM